MTNYRSANGKMIDMAALRAKHESTRAVGNMNVNAKGDVIDAHNRVIEQSGRRVDRAYNQTTKSDVATKPPVVERSPRVPTEQLNEFERELEADDFVPKKD